jgi:thymidine phosphorylase
MTMVGRVPEAPGAEVATNHVHRARRLGIDTGQEPVVYLHRDSIVCRSEGFGSEIRLWVRRGDRAILATLNVITGSLLAPDEAGFSEAAWSLLAPRADDTVEFAHPLPLDSLSHVRAKIYGRRMDGAAINAVVTDIAAGRYSDIHLSSFLTACAGDRLDRQELVDLTRAMVTVGDQLRWTHPRVFDKHSAGGLPGNRTTMIVVPIAAALGLVMPKTSSRAITSPAGTADAMETLAPVALDRDALQRVVDREGGCIVWGGAANLSPADDVMIRVERPLDLDSPGQLVASVLSKKVAVGATHVLIDVPVGPTAKLRTLAEAEAVSDALRDVGGALGLEVLPVITDGTQPVGRRVGPALEARDVLAVLRGEPDAPQDLRERALLLAGYLLELAGAAPAGAGQALARSALDDGRAWRKFQAICAAQGGMREPPVARFTRPVEGTAPGRVSAIDNRRLARVAKLAGAPGDPAAGLELHVRVGESVAPGQPLFTVHAQASGALDYALAYAARAGDIVRIEPLR